MLVYNSQTHRKEELVPIEEGKIRMYVCGPTVYDQIHIGNARTFLSFDVIRRYLMYKGYQVTFASSISHSGPRRGPTFIPIRFRAVFTGIGLTSQNSALISGIASS